jgi:DNA-binding CsgD family transcriptional regulator
MPRPGVALLERDTELTAITDALHGAVEGAASVLLLEGVAGIGKTRLLREARHLADGMDLRVLSARPTPLDADLPWNVVRQLLVPALPTASSARQTHLLSGAARLAAPPLGLMSASADVDSFAPLHGLYWLVANLAHDSPILMAIDDLQWCDVASLRFIIHFVSRNEGLPVVLIGAIRSGEPSALVGPLESLAANPSVQVIQPRPLTLAASAELIAREVANPISAEVVEACHRMTGGNPFLLNELVREIEDARRPVTAAWVRSISPASLTRSVMARLTRLGSPALALARAVAVLGGSAHLKVAAELVNLGLDDGAAAADRLIRAGVVVTHDEKLDFAHPLVREAVYGELSPPVRWRLHAAAARLLSAWPDQTQEVAAQLLATAPAADPWTVERLRAAARAARDEGAPELAASYLERALAEPPQSDPQSEILIELGTLETHYDPARAVDRFQAAAPLVFGDRQPVRLAQLHARALAAAGRYDEAAAVINARAEQAATLDRETAGRFSATRFAVCRWDLDCLDTAEEVFTAVRDRAGRGETLTPPESANLANELAARGEDRLVAIEHARRAIAAPYEPFLSQTTPILATVLVHAGELIEAQTAITAALKDARTRGSRLDWLSATSALAYAVLARGQTSNAVVLASDALELADDGLSTLLPLLTLVEALIQRGEVDQGWAALGQRGLDSQLGSSWPETMLRYRRGRLQAASHRHAEALEDLFEVGRLVDAWRAPNPAQIAWRSSAARSLLALDRTDEARRLAAEELVLAQRWGADVALGVAQSVVGQCDSSPSGIDMLGRAVDRLGRSQARLELARAQCELGTRLRRERRPAEAREPLRAALDLADRCGGLAVADRAREELLAAGLKPRRAARSGREALTPRELRVAELAATGMTNREIAQALFITARTVEHHLSSCYAKLGIQVRRQLGAALAGDAPRHPESPTLRRQAKK